MLFVDQCLLNNFFWKLYSLKHRFSSGEGESYAFESTHPESVPVWNHDIGVLGVIVVSALAVRAQLVREADARKHNLLQRARYDLLALRLLKGSGAGRVTTTRGRRAARPLMGEAINVEMVRPEESRSEVEEYV